MPKLIEHIDAIARAQGRAVLYLAFHPAWRDLRAGYDYQDDAMRSQVLEWLDAHGFAWRECGGFASTSVQPAYQGQVCLDVPFDMALSEYRRLSAYLEHPDGSMRHDGVRFMVMPLDYAMRNAEHDEPGFWDRWAEQF